MHHFVSLVVLKKVFIALSMGRLETLPALGRGKTTYNSSLTASTVSAPTAAARFGFFSLLLESIFISANYLCKCY